ncbi:MAG TPA: hypothetical protein VFC82_06415 [Actinomycetaceae bacterium]|nr:hypothetical protein [Actinomycetaceae bacterium]
MSRQRRILTAAVAAPFVAGGAAAAAVFFTGTHRRLGTTSEEATRDLPGDEIFPLASIQNDRATTIEAAPEAVWPWIAQLGQDKAGFYSFEVLENAVGCEITNADSINPEWQHPEVGGSFPLAPGMELRVAEVEPGGHLVVSSRGAEAPEYIGDGIEFDFTWAFVLTPVTGDNGALGTRLHIRERYEPKNRKTARMVQAVTWVSALMTWRMMGNIRRLAARPAA